MPVSRTTPRTLLLAIELRHEPTPTEAKLWSYLKGNQLNGQKFRRQHAIGSFITDFCCIKQKLIIELDGGQHLEQEDYDSTRTAYLQSRGYSVLRFWNNDVMNNIEEVISSILDALDGRNSLG